VEKRPVNGAAGRHRRVSVVTGGGRGIGAAIAGELARGGDFVVTVDPLVMLDGRTDPDATLEPTTADRIVAGGGAARAVASSVTDLDALRDLFGALVDEFGAVHTVVNVAGITRPTGFASGSESDWRGVLSVHLAGYFNVLRAALPHMAEAGSGRILGITSGAGWRQTDAGAYSCAKRAVASLTWQLGRIAPPGVTINALSPIAMTRMVEAAMARNRPVGRSSGGDRTAGASTAAGRPGGGPAAGGLKLGSGMPPPEEVAPLAAYLLGEDSSWCSGQVLFAAGSELAVIGPPRLLEVIHCEPAGAARVLDEAGAAALVPAHEGQISTGGAGPRFAGLIDRATRGPSTPADGVQETGSTCGVVTDDADRAGVLRSALSRRWAGVTALEPGVRRHGFEAASIALEDLEARSGPLGALVVWLDDPSSAPSQPDWQAVLGGHDGIAERILGDAAFARAAADHAERTGRPVRLVTIVDASTAAGRTRAQASAQLTRSAEPATEGLVAAFTVGIEAGADPETVGHLAAYLTSHPDAAGLSGAELAAGSGWIGLRSHPSVSASIAHGGPGVPDWLDGVLREATSGVAGGS
jgi:NAD(P)-dependent dehydrogenase (short-subunit alcohol dehydrogenase family)